MAKTDENLMKRLLALFADEAEEHLDGIGSGLAKLQAAPDLDDPQVVETVFREVHSLKGAARSVELGRIEHLCQSVEQQFASLRKGETRLDQPLLDSLGEALAGIEQAVHEATGKGASAAPASTDGPAPVEAPAAEPAGLGTVRIDAGKLDALLLIAEEQLQLRMAVQGRHAEARELADKLHAALRAHDAAGASRRAAETFLTAVRQLAHAVDALTHALDHDRYAVTTLTEHLLTHSKQLAMLPFAEITMRLPKLVGDLARGQGKLVSCEITGDSLQADRRLLAALRDPLLHLMRNGVDHGIEPPDVRRRQGKPERGRITVAIAQADAGMVTVTIADDGAGIDIAGLRQLARDRGQELTDEELVETIFQSGVTTRAEATTVSGRGLGMAIVRDTVEGLGGTVQVRTRTGAGCRCTLRVPATVATYRGAFVHAGGQQFIVPTASIDRVLRRPRTAVRTVENRETVTVGDRAVAVVRLNTLLGLRPGGDVAAGDSIALVVVRNGDERVALAVDDVIRESEVLAKHLGPLLADVPYVSGCAALPTGELVLVLNAAELARAAGTVSSEVRPEEAAEGSRGRLLVVEDSITARVLLQSILEAAGYDVRTAVDGAEAYAMVRGAAFDLVVSDVEMPRMDGFELTARIRATRATADLPVILVTALDSDEDRERGVQAGANAYLAKSSFDQTSLIELIERFI